MRIVWLVRNKWPETIGGVELQVDAVSGYMRRWGHHVALWVGSLSADYVDRLPDGRAVVGWGQQAVPERLWRIGPIWRTVQAARSLPRNGPVDVVFSPDPLLACAYRLRQWQVPLIYCPGGTLADSFEWNYPSNSDQPARGPIGRAFMPVRQHLLAERFCLQRTPGIVAVSSLVKKQMIRIDGGCRRRIRVIYNGYDPDDVQADRRDAQSELASSRPFTAICVARLDRIKNIEHLIRAWALVRWGSKRLMIVGEGREMSALKALARRLGVGDTIEFLGWRLDVQRCLAQADVLVLPSLYEAFGLVVVEVMAASLPCITLKNVEGISQVAASGEINIDGVTGFCVDPHEPAAMAEKIDCLAEHPDLSRRIGRAGRRRVEAEFTWERAARAYCRFAEDIVARHRRRRGQEI